MAYTGLIIQVVTLQDGRYRLDNVEILDGCYANAVHLYTERNPRKAGRSSRFSTGQNMLQIFVCFLEVFSNCVGPTVCLENLHCENGKIARAYKCHRICFPRCCQLNQLQWRLFGELIIELCF